jgi:hypothetical protein
MVPHRCLSLADVDAWQNKDRRNDREAHSRTQSLCAARAKPWMSENARMGIFDTAALAYMFFHSINGDRQVA